MTVLGKTIANGYALTAIVGKKEVMEAAQSTFISSTFWTERIGPAAALKTLEVFEKEQPWNYITEMGSYVTKQWKLIAEKHHISIDTFGIPALAGFSFNSKDALKYKTYITQELLKKGYLASTVLYSSTAHSKNIIDNYLFELDSVFNIIDKCERLEVEIDSLIEGPVCHGGFKRLN
jgi:glutamate-1-semialdehyde aminotransferase